jgi:hypothetical protein
MDPVTTIQGDRRSGGSIRNRILRGRLAALVRVS